MAPRPRGPLCPPPTRCPTFALSPSPLLLRGSQWGRQGRPGARAPGPFGSFPERAEPGPRRDGLQPPRVHRERGSHTSCPSRQTAGASSRAATRQTRGRSGPGPWPPPGFATASGAGRLGAQAGAGPLTGSALFQCIPAAVVSLAVSRRNADVVSPALSGLCALGSCTAPGCRRDQALRADRHVCVRAYMCAFMYSCALMCVHVYMHTRVPGGMHLTAHSSPCPPAGRLCPPTLCPGAEAVGLPTSDLGQG